MPKFQELPELLTVEEAADALRISRSTAYEMTQLYRANPATGLPVIRLGRRLRVPKHSIETMLARVSTMSSGVEIQLPDDQRLIES